jgi:hypothetical protein
MSQQRMPVLQYFILRSTEPGSFTRQFGPVAPTIKPGPGPTLILFEQTA